jgi:mono/diheme cytochrome c family protein
VDRAVSYLAFPAPVGLAAALGPDWSRRAKTMEFRALDGYVSRIDVARLTSGKAYFAFARADRSPFAVDNLAQNEKNVPLGPYYLVWNNRSDPELLAAGARDWPYQVDDVLISDESDAALRPPGFDPALEPGLAKVEAQCLTCHKVNGYGGDKAGGNLAAIARSLARSDFVKPEPSAVRPGATMPALSPYAPEAERRATAESIYAYLSEVPVVPDR